MTYASIRLFSMALALAAGMVYADSPATKPATPASQPATAAANTVSIDNFKFTPKELTVAVGAKVAWVNKDDVPHTATSTTKPRTIDSGTLDTDASYTLTFQKPGTYPYFCAVHPHMTGTIIVK